ncbi:putative quinol monooxygenase [Olivibacter sp. XZL3]|uniref:putative quinol monooxygenase n=1 Tax=Olivibacter sp. XZL3 TaxID=1735116 RepID=UPI001066A47E|nr:putative quinol monooxygenase [Olivibacter sp. XZL3]
MKINLTAFIKSKTDCTEEIKGVLKDLVVQSKKEPACLQYDLHQSVEDPNVFIFHEVWKDEEGFALHNEQPYIKTFRQTASEKLQEIPIIYRTDII